jgi:CheY-like chemotaxis protein
MPESAPDRNYRRNSSNNTGEAERSESIDLAMRFSTTILCVDDDEDDQLFLREVILSQPYSFHIKEVQNGQEAMNYLKNCLQQGELPCLIIMDLNMPKMDGRQTIQKIREEPGLSMIPIAVFTTSSQQADKTHFEEQGLFFITKPFDYDVFKSRVADILRHCAGF